MITRVSHSSKHTFAVSFIERRACGMCLPHHVDIHSGHYGSDVSGAIESSVGRTQGSVGVSRLEEQKPVVVPRQMAQHTTLTHHISGCTSVSKTTSHQQRKLNDNTYKCP